MGQGLGFKLSKKSQMLNEFELPQGSFLSSSKGIRWCHIQSHTCLYFSFVALMIMEIFGWLRFFSA